MLKNTKHQVSKATTELNFARYLYKAIENGDYASCEQFLKLDANSNLLLPEGITPFHLAVGNNASNAAELVKLCLKYGANVNSRSAEGLTPVHISAIWGKVDILKVLLNNGGDPSLVDEDNDTALDLALENDQTESVNILLEHEKCKNIRLSLTSLSLGEDTFLVKKTNKRSFVIPKTPTFPQPTCCQVSPKEKNACQNPAETSFRLRRSLSDSLFSRSYSSSWNLEKYFSQSSPSTDLHSKSLFDIDLGHSSPNRSSNKVQVNITKKSTPTDPSSMYITCNETNLELPQTPRLNEPKRKISVENNFTTDYSFSPGEVLSCDPRTQDQFDLLMESPTNKNGIVGDAILIKKRNFNIKVDEDNFSTSSPLLSMESNYEDAKSEFDLHKIKRKIRLHNANEDDDSEEFLYTDKAEGVALIERWQSNNASSSVDDGEIHSWKYFSTCENEEDVIKEEEVDVGEVEKLNNTELRAQLTENGDDPGPITPTTRRTYQLRLAKMQQYPLLKSRVQENVERVYSKELQLVLEGKLNIQKLKDLEEKMCEIFDHTTSAHQQWREGRLKNCFNYLLLDPRVTKNLPARAHVMTPEEQLKIFVSSIFYIGKGKRTRPYTHLYEAALYLKRANHKITPNNKVQHILNIWADGQGVVSLHCFQNVIPVEAYTREACMVDSIGLKNLTNARSGDVYGAVSRWTGDQKRRLGAFLIYRACKILLNEGERQIRPSDV